MKRLSPRFFTMILFILGSSLLFGQTTTLDLSYPLPVDPDVRIGKLDNGLTYYIRRNGKPDKRVELRLAVNAGSILENDNQQGLAHFMEHMNFNGTKTFPKNELIDFLQKTGVEFGADINAYTSFDETVYMLQLPTDDTALVNKGYQVLEDWSHNALLDSTEVDKERGVIIEEWRLGLGAQDRMMKKIFPVIFKDSKYADRIPIGKVDILEHFNYHLLQNFYHDWYRPDLMAVIVVGDIDPVKTEAQIKAHFSYMKNPVPEKPRPAFDLPDNKEPLIAIASDKEATNNMVMVFYKHPVMIEKNLGDFREKLLEELYTGMLNNRFGEIAQRPEAPYIMASSEYGRFLARTRDSYLLYTGPKENQIGKSLSTLLSENERVKRFGFTATEFERQKEDMLTRYEKASKEVDKTESMKFTDEYVQNFLNTDPIPGAVKEFKYVSKLLPGIKLEEINALASRFITDENMAVLVTAPEKESIKVPTRDEILSIIHDSKTAQLTAYVDKFREEPLIQENLTSGKVVSRKENKELGFTELKLSNGVTLALKPTTFKNDEIQFEAYGLGGNSLYPDNEFMSANYASQVIDMSGVGNFDNIELQKKLKGKNLEIHPYIEETRQGFRGNSTPKDIETLLQLVYLYCKSPRKDTTAFQAYVSQMENQMKFMKNNPMMTFYDTLFKSVYPGYKRFVIFPTENQMKELNLNEIYKIYTDRFSDASGFKFFLVGNFNIDSITPMLEKYLGSLPSLNRNETWKDESPKIPAGIREVSFNKGVDPQSMVGLVITEGFEWNPKNLLMLSMLREIISIKLIEVIREQLSGVYSPQVMLQPEHFPQPRFNFGVLFGCSPTMPDSLTNAVIGEIDKLRNNGPSAVDLEKAQETLIRARETDFEKNDFWLGKIQSLYYDNTDPASILNFKDRVKALTVDDLKKAAIDFLDTKHYVRVVLLPEKK
jgi:zinc protease